MSSLPPETSGPSAESPSAESPSAETPSAAEAPSASGAPTAVTAVASAEPVAAPDMLKAVRNTVKLVGSLGVTYGIALALRVLLPRMLGPEVFGQFSWAESTAALFFMAAGLGIDVYVRKEVAVRPEHASEFFGGTFLLRVGLGVLLLVGMGGMMTWYGEPVAVRTLTLLMGVAQFFFVTNNTLAATLHAREQVDGLSVMNIVGKSIWGVGLLAALFLRVPLMMLALPLLAAEATKMVVLFRLARKHAGLQLRLDWKATRVMMVASLPLFLNEAALAASGRVDSSMLGFFDKTKAEVGYYGAAYGLAGMAMVITPIIGWVLMPMLSRAAARSQEELTTIIRRGLEATLAFALPVTLAMAVGADVWIWILCGDKFAPAALTLQVLAPTYVLTYVATVGSICLMVLNRAWTVTFTSIVAMVLNPLLNLVLISMGLRLVPAGGGAAGAALAMALSELLTVLVLLWRIGDKAFDRRSLTMLVKTLVVCGVVAALDFFLRPRLGPWRLVPSALVYVLLIFATGAVRVDEMLKLVRLARNRRQLAEQPSA